MTDDNNILKKESAPDSPAAHDKSTRVFPPYLLWFVAIPVLPFFFYMGMLSFSIDPPREIFGVINSIPPTLDTNTIFNDVKDLFTNTEGDIKYIAQPAKTLTHLSDMLTYLSIASLHVIVCLVVIGFFLYQIHQLPKTLVKRTYLYMSVTTVILIIFAYVIDYLANNLMLIQLGYKSICVLLSMADLQTGLVGGLHTLGPGVACYEPKATSLDWLAWTPVMFGVLAMISASAFTTIMASEPIPSADEQWRPNFLARVKILQKSLYVLSLVLVTSTITIKEFTSLPLELLENNIFKPEFKDFIISITTFWGGMFTATLFAAFAPAVFLLVRHKLAYQKGLTDPSDLKEWFHESVFVSIKTQSLNALTIIAPMLVGPFSDMVQKLSGMVS